MIALVYKVPAWTKLAKLRTDFCKETSFSHLSLHINIEFSLDQLFMAGLSLFKVSHLHLL